MRDKHKNKYLIFFSVLIGALLAFLFFQKIKNYSGEDKSSSQYSSAKGEGTRSNNNVNPSTSLNSVQDNSIRSEILQQAQDETEYLSNPEEYNYLNAKVKIRENVFLVEIPTTEDKMIQGLSEKNSLDSQAGMLFIFPEKSNHLFTMNNMKFDLDFIFILDNKIVDIKESISSDSSDRIFSEEKYDKVLELKAGTIKKANINIGQEIEINYR